MPRYTYDHIHLRTRDSMAMAQYFNKMFDAKIVKPIQSDGQPRIDIDRDDLVLFIAQALPNSDIPVLPSDPFNWIISTYLGVDHSGLPVDNIDDILSELKNRGARNRRGATDFTPRGAYRLHPSS